MANFFQDNADLLFLFDHLDLAEIATAQEDGFEAVDGPGKAYAPIDAEDAVDNYRRLVDIVGDIAANRIAPRAERVDRDGHTLNADGTVTVGEGVLQNLAVLRQADLMGFTLPRKYGGLNGPNIVFTMITEIIARADASLVNLFGLQGIGETIHAFGDEALKDEYLTRFAEGEVTGAMALTEPDAGSDLQAVGLRARQDDDGQWRLNGIKRFITNGCGDVILTLARSEPDISDGRGLSLFVVDKGPRLTVRHLEEKLGIHGSPTCELVYDDTPAKIIGERQLGLIRYVMSLMNGARLGIAAQSLGVAEAAYREARDYAAARKQFGAAIEKLPAVAELVVDMRVAIEATRALVYESTWNDDLEKNNTRVLETKPPADKDDLKRRKKRGRVLKRLNGMLTPMSKYYASEMCLRVANDALQVLGGSGYMTDFPVERYLRDARITTIYEGTSQLQVVAAVRGVCGGTFEKHVAELEQTEYLDKDLNDLKQKLDSGKTLVLEAIANVKKHGVEYMDLYGRKLVDSAIAVLIGHLLLQQAKRCERKRLVARRFIDTQMESIRRDVALIASGDRSVLDHYEAIAGPVAGS